MEPGFEIDKDQSTKQYILTSIKYYKISKQKIRYKIRVS